MNVLRPKERDSLTLDIQLPAKWCAACTKFSRKPTHAYDFPSRWNSEGNFVYFNWLKRFQLLRSRQSSPTRAFSCLNPLEQFGRGFVLRILLHQLSPHGEIENEPAQARDGVGRRR